MEPFEIIFDPGSLSRSTSDLYGQLSIRVGDHFFPDRSWNDFVARLLDWWTENIYAIQRQPDVSFKFRFFNGPFYFRINGKGDLLELALATSSKDTGERFMVSREAFFNELVRVSRSLIDASDRLDFSQPELENLRRRISVL